MAVTSSDPLYPSLGAFWNRLVALNWLVHSLQSQLEQFRAAAQDHLDQGSSLVGGYAGLRAVDMTISRQGCLVKEPIGYRDAEGQAYLDLTDSWVAWSSAHAFAEAYEGFETFIQDTIAAFLLCYPNCRPEPDRLIPATNLQEWEAYVRKYFRRRKPELMEFLRGRAPKLSNIEKENYRGLNLADWFAVATQVRHSATHSNMLLKSSTTMEWCENQKQILWHYFPGTDERDGYRLNISADHAHDNFEIFADYSFAIYRLLSVEGRFGIGSTFDKTL